MYQETTFMSSLMNYLFRKFGIKVKPVSPYNHQSLQAEHGIKSLSTILTKHLTEEGQMWDKYLPLATFAYNTFNTPQFSKSFSLQISVPEKTKITTRFRD